MPPGLEAGNSAYPYFPTGDRAVCVGVRYIAVTVP